MPNVALIFLCLSFGATVKIVFSLIHGMKTSQRQEEIYGLGDRHPGPWLPAHPSSDTSLAASQRVWQLQQPSQEGRVLTANTLWGCGKTEPGL